MGAVAGPGMESLAVASGSGRAVRGLEKICHLYINPLASTSSSVISVARFAGLGQSFYFLTPALKCWAIVIRPLCGRCGRTSSTMEEHGSGLI
jgi:hypothetical protein